LEFVLEVDNLRLLHLVVEVVALAGPLADTGEHRQTGVLRAMLLISSIMFTVLPTPAPPNRPTLPPLANGHDQVDHLDARLEQLFGRGELFVGRGLAVDRGALLLADRAALVDGIAEHVHDAPERLTADGHGDRRTGVLDARPRDRPSEEPMAMVRTTPSPSCCCTSSVRSFSVTFRAS
jgi:hypothetical protein